MSKVVIRKIAADLWLVAAHESIGSTSEVVTSWVEAVNVANTLIHSGPQHIPYIFWGWTPWGSVRSIVAVWQCGKCGLTTRTPVGHTHWHDSIDKDREPDFIREEAEL